MLCVFWGNLRNPGWANILKVLEDLMAYNSLELIVLSDYAKIQVVSLNVNIILQIFRLRHYVCINPVCGAVEILQKIIC